MSTRNRLGLVVPLLSLACACSHAVPSPEEARDIPQSKPRTETVSGKEDWEDRRGFGADEAATQMRNLMMVEGSGYEGMKGMEHSPAAHPSPELRADDKTTPTNSSPFRFTGSMTPDPPVVGGAVFHFALADAQSGKPATGVALTLEVFMTQMDMGIQEAKVQELEPGKYRATIQFPMKGEWELRLRSHPRTGETSRAWENVLRVEVK